MGGKRYRRLNLTDEPNYGEFEAIERLRARLPAAPPGELWLGDDAALIEHGWLLTTDALVGGLDWDPAFSAEDDVGWRSVMVNASDLAAMGALTERLLVAVVAPPGFGLDNFYDGATSACEALGAAVVGGDLSAAPAGTDLCVIAVTAAGRCPGGRAVTRGGARPGDRIWLSGPVGAAAAGLRMLRAGARVAEREKGDCVSAHLSPVARTSHGVAAAAAGATAMVDISDGLAADAWHVARASGVSLGLNELPVAAGATEDEAIAGGDDYELLCTAAPEVELDGWLPVGICGEGPAALTLRGEPLEPRGYAHWRTT